MPTPSRGDLVVGDQRGTNRLSVLELVRRPAAATFAAPLTDQGIVGAEDLLPATFLVIVGTVTIYGLAAAPAARLLGIATPADEATPGCQPPASTQGP